MTPRAAVLIEPNPGWASTLASSLVHGSHAFVITREPENSIEGRRAGFELRDTVLVLSAGPTARYAFLFRKPPEGDTVLSQIIATGVGGLHVAACRIGWGANAPSQEEWNTKGSTGSGSANIGQNTEGMRKAYAAGAVLVPAGRWPPNVLLVHAPGCRNLGSHRVKGNPTSKSFHEAYDGESKTGFPRGWSHPGNQHADPSGMETIDAYDCVESCPVHVLDQQTGDRPATLTGRADPDQVHENPGDNHGTSTFGGGNSNVYADSGGASRYYPQFANDDEMFAWMQRLLEIPRGAASIPPEV